MIRKTRIKDFTKPGGQVAELDAADWLKLPAPYDQADKPLKKLTDDQAVALVRAARLERAARMDTGI